MTRAPGSGLDQDLVAAALPRYEIRREIGRGGWGVVYHAHHPTLQRSAAVKVLPRAFAADPVTRDRFVAEAQTVANLDHPHVVSVFDFLEHDGVFLIVMEYMPGGTLWKQHTERGVGSDEACAITVAIASALHAAHRRQIVHRDIKPDNVLFTDGGVPKLGDFGIAKGLRAAPRLTEVGQALGTPAYMSPEQATGAPVSERSDLYSLGVVLYELLAGRLPFPIVADPAAQLYQHVHVVPDPLPPEVPAGIGRVVMSALAKDPSDRPSSAERLGLALAEAAEHAYGSDWVSSSGIELLGADAPVQAATTSTARRPATALPSYTDAVQVLGHERVGTMVDPPPSVAVYALADVEDDSGAASPGPTDNSASASAEPASPGAVAPAPPTSSARETIAPVGPTPKPPPAAVDPPPQPELTVTEPVDGVAARTGGRSWWRYGAVLIVLVVAAAVLIGVLRDGDPDVGAYCEPASDFVTADPFTTLPDDLDPVVASGTDAAREAPDDIVEAWLTSVGALQDVRAARAGALADDDTDPTAIAEVIAATARLDQPEVRSAAAAVASHVESTCR